MRYIVDKKGSHTLAATKKCIPFIQSFIHKGIHKKRKEMAEKNIYGQSRKPLSGRNKVDFKTRFLRQRKRFRTLCSVMLCCVRSCSSFV